MRRLLAILGFTFCQPVSATICLNPPIETQIREANVAFVATVVSASSATPIDNLSNGEDYRVDYSYIVRQTIKGDPRLVTTLYTNNTYQAYETDIEIHTRETRLLPGDNILVIASSAGAVQVAACTPSRSWEPGMLDLLGIGWPSNNSFKPNPLRGSA